MKQIYKEILIVIFAIFTQISITYSQVSEAPIGNGTSENPYQISTLENLYWISQNPASWDKYFIQMHDINAAATATWDSNKGWTPIGNNVQKFNGFYNGNNYIISNLYIDRPTENNVGLFGHVGQVNSDTEPTLIKSLGIVNATVNGARGVGALIGRVTGNQNTIIEYCYAIGGTIKGDGATGGLIGSLNSFEETSDGSKNPVLRKSYSTNSVQSSGNGTLDKFGGLVGCSQKGSIQNSFARGHVTVNDGTRVGGLVGCIDYRGDVENSYATGEVTTTASTNVGGLVGNISGIGTYDGEVTNSVWDTEVSTLGASAGGTAQNISAMKTSATYSSLSWDITTTWGIAAGINNGYPYLLGDNNFILPIELASFEGQRISSEIIELRWTTESEFNNEGFEIQKSYNGTTFHTIAWIKGKGNTSIQQEYSFLDYESSTNIVYYRLVQFDRNGDYTYSDIITINSVTPPKEDLLIINKQCVLQNVQQDALYTITVIKESGKIKYSYTCKAPAETIICPYVLEEGVYILSIYKQQLLIATHKIKM